MRISFDFGSDEGVADIKKFMNEAAELVSSYGGSLSGEHGDGRARSLLDRMYSEKRDLFKKFKNILIPMGYLTPSSRRRRRGHRRAAHGWPAEI